MFTYCRRIAQAGLAGATLFFGALSPAGAADIFDRYGQNSSPYDDPRYADVYQYPPPRAYAEPPPYAPAPRYEPTPRYEPRPYAQYEEAPPPRDTYGYLRPMRPRDYAGRADTCMPHQEIRRSLAGEGWRDFRDVELRGEIAVVEARRPNGRPYHLKIDRCSGEIVKATPLDERPVPYAYRDRYGRAY